MVRIDIEKFLNAEHSSSEFSSLVLGNHVV